MIINDDQNKIITELMNSIQFKMNEMKMIELDQV